MESIQVGADLMIRPDLAERHGVSAQLLLIQRDELAVFLQCICLVIDDDDHVIIHGEKVDVAIEDLIADPGLIRCMLCRVQVTFWK